MDALNTLITQFRQFWRRTSPTGRVVSVASIATVIATMIGVAVWSSRPDYKLLRDGISPVVTAEIVSILDANGIPNQMNYSGSGVLVPTSRWNDANVAIASLNVPEPTGGGMIPGIAEPPTHQDELRAKEQSLELTLQTYQPIRSANVHLAVPKPSPFVRDNLPASASVILEAEAGQFLSQELVTSVKSTVAAAVQGMDAKSVSVTDASGRRWGAPDEDTPYAQRVKMRRDIETELAMKAEEMLTKVVGLGKATVRVTAEIDPYLQREEVKKVIDAEGKVVMEEEIQNEDTKGMPARSGGVAGTSSNGGTATASVGVNTTEKTSEDIKTSYEYPTTTTTTIIPGGGVTRLSVAVTVDATPDPADPAGNTPLLTQEKAEEIVTNAVGLDATRGDQISVTITKFAPTDPIVPISPVPDTKQWEFISEMARNASLGLAAIAALLIGIMTIKKLKPISVPTTREDERQRALLSELSSRIDQNPEAMSRILASWLGNQSEEEAGDQRKAA